MKTTYYTGGNKGWGTLVTKCDCGALLSEYKTDEEGRPTEELFDYEDEHSCSDPAMFMVESDELMVIMTYDYANALSCYEAEIKKSMPGKKVWLSSRSGAGEIEQLMVHTSNEVNE